REHDRHLEVDAAVVPGSEVGARLAREGAPEGGASRRRGGGSPHAGPLYPPVGTVADEPADVREHADLPRELLESIAGLEAGRRRRGAEVGRAEMRPGGRLDEGRLRRPLAVEQPSLDEVAEREP